MPVRRNPETGDIKISQEGYIDALLREFGMEDSDPVRAPMDPDFRLSPHQPSSPDILDETFTPSLYRKALGSLQFLVSSTRADIAFPVNYLSRFNSSSPPVAWQAVKRIFRYLKRTLDLGITFKNGVPDLKPYTYTDSDRAGADPAYRSTLDYVVLIAGSPVSWRSQRQASVSKSTTQAEYIAASEAACELIWLANLLIHAGVLDEDHSQSPIRSSYLFIDNKGAIDLAQTDVINRQSRHIEVKYHLLRYMIDKQEIIPQHVLSADNIADGFTKPLGWIKFSDFLSKLGYLS